jgi:hypothetical protein
MPKEASAFSPCNLLGKRCNCAVELEKLFLSKQHQTIKTLLQRNEIELSILKAIA